MPVVVTTMIAHKKNAAAAVKIVAVLKGKSAVQVQAVVPKMQAIMGAAEAKDAVAGGDAALTKTEKMIYFRARE